MHELYSVGPKLTEKMYKEIFEIIKRSGLDAWSGKQEMALGIVACKRQKSAGDDEYYFYSVVSCVLCPEVVVSANFWIIGQ